MKALIKRVCIGIFLFLTSTLGAFADLADAHRALLTGQYAQAITYAREINDRHPVDAALITARALIELGKPAEAEQYAAFAVQISPTSFSARLLLATAQQRVVSVLSA